MGGVDTAELGILGDACLVAAGGEGNTQHIRLMHSQLQHPTLLSHCALVLTWKYRHHNLLHYNVTMAMSLSRSSGLLWDIFGQAQVS